MPTSRTGRDAAERLAADLRQITGDRLRAVVVYEAHGEWDDGAGGIGRAHAAQVHTLGLIEHLSGDDLARCAALMPEWKRHGLDVPILMGPEEFRRSLDAFPLEFSQILSHLDPIVGGEVFEGLAVNPEDLRRACETQAKSHLLHLRQGYLEAAGEASAVTRLVTASAVPLRALLVNIARLTGARPAGVAALLEFVERELRLPVAGLRPVLAPSRQDRLDGPEIMDAFQAYLKDVEALATMVDEGLR